MNLLDQSSGLTRRVAEKYEQASALSDNDAERKGVALIATSLKETVVAHQLYKSQMRLVSDEKITDQKTFEEKFKHYLDQITQQQRESDEHYSQGKRLLGL
jgi:aconitase B